MIIILSVLAVVILAVLTGVYLSLELKRKYNLNSADTLLACSAIIFAESLFFRIASLVANLFGM